MKNYGFPKHRKTHSTLLLGESICCMKAGKDLSCLILRYDFYTLHLTHVQYKYLYMYTSGITERFLFVF